MIAFAHHRRAILSPVSRASRFIAAAGLTDSTHQRALYELESALLSAGVLMPIGQAGNRILALYPMVGGTAAAHAFNFVDIATFPLAYVNGPTHSARGIAFNGTTQYAEAPFRPDQLTPANAHMAFYADAATTDASTSGKAVMGAGSTANSDFSLAINRGTLNFFSCADNASFVSHTAPAALAGLVIGSRTAANLNVLYHAGAELARSTNTALGTMPGTTLVRIGGNALVNSFSLIPCSFASIGLSLTAAQVTAYYTAIQAFQTTLGRAR